MRTHTHTHTLLIHCISSDALFSVCAQREERATADEPQAGAPHEGADAASGGGEALAAGPERPGELHPPVLSPPRH